MTCRLSPDRDRVALPTGTEYVSLWLALAPTVRSKRAGHSSMLSVYAHPSQKAHQEVADALSDVLAVGVNLSETDFSLI